MILYNPVYISCWSRLNCNVPRPSVVCHTKIRYDYIVSILQHKSVSKYNILFRHTSAIRHSSSGAISLHRFTLDAAIQQMVSFQKEDRRQHCTHSFITSMDNTTLVYKMLSLPQTQKTILAYSSSNMSPFSSKTIYWMKYSIQIYSSNVASKVFS